MTFDASVNGERRRLTMSTASERVSYAWGESTGELEIREVEPGVYAVMDGLRSITVTVAEGGWVEAGGEVFQVDVTDPRKATLGGGAAGRGGEVKVAAPMPGRVVRVLVQAGDVVAAGQGLVVVEAMKMQNEMKAPRDATVTVVKTVDGATVGAGDVLMILE